MHHIHHTEGIIVASRNTGEADKMLSIYTRDFGMVFAHARGIRKLESKLRYALQDYALARVNLVRGKSGWRVTSATPGIFVDFKKHPLEAVIIANLSRLLIRLVNGEEKSEEVFQTLKSGIELLVEGISDDNQRRALESLSVLKLLFHLGYLSVPPDLAWSVEESLSADILDRAWQM